MTLHSPSCRSLPTSLAIALAALAGTGCSLSPPPYAAPTNSEAMSSMAAGVMADVGQPLPERSDVPITPATVNVPRAMLRNTGNVLQEAADVETRLTMVKNLRTLAAVQIGDCSWQAVDVDEVQRVSRERTRGADRAYLCEYQEYHDTPSRGPVRSTGRGYFYKAGERFFHAGVESSSFEEVDALPAA